MLLGVIWPEIIRIPGVFKNQGGFKNFDPPLSL
jgi:hypothetical protein